MKKLWNSFKIAFSMYSKIPMPKSDWTNENMRYCFCFFPLVGGVVGALTCVWRYLAEYLGLRGSTSSAVVLMLIPVAVTGGIHLDGLLDTADALSSYKGQKERLEILKDSRAGAFAVIQAVVYFFLYYGIYSYLDACPGKRGEVAFPKAKETGLAALFSQKAEGRAVKIVLVCYGILIFVFMAGIDIFYALAVYTAAFLVFIYYYFMSVNKFGGITGDLAGWFLQNCEIAMALGVMIVHVAGGVV